MKKLPWIFFISLIFYITILISTLGISGCTDIYEDVHCSIISVVPNAGCPEDTVIISGANFGVTAGSVSFNNVIATINSWSDNSIVVNAQGGDYLNVTVTPMLVNPCSLAGSYSYDNVAPPVPTTTFPADGSMLCTTTVNSVISCDDPLNTCEERINVDDWQACGTGFVVPSSGTYTVDGRCIDSCGNISTLRSVTFDVDTVAPVVTIISPNEWRCIASSTVTVDAGSDGGELVSCTIDGVSPIVAPGSWALVGEGLHTIACSSTDACGNDSLPESMGVVVDTVEPEVTISSPSLGECISSSAVVVDGSITELGSGVKEITVEAGVYTVTGDSFPITLDILADGEYTITVWVEDNCGNISLEAVVANVKVDTVAPVVEVSSPTSGKVFSIDKVTVTGSVTDAEPSSGIVGVWVDGAKASITGTNWIVTLTGLSEGSVTISVRADDCAGNEGVAAVNITVDPIAPSVSIDIPTSGTTINEATVVVEGSASDTPPSSELEKVVVNGKTASGTEDWMVTVSGLAEGWNSITAMVWDNAGNYSSTSVDIFVDTVAPEVIISSPVFGDCINTTAVEVAGTITEAGSGVELITVMAIGPAAFSATGSGFPVNLTVSIDGIYLIMVQVSDDAGNSSPVLWVSNVLVDTIDPVVSIGFPSSGDCIASSTVAVDAGSDGGELMSCTIDGVSPIEVPGSWDGVADGPHTIECSATDDCGNTGSASVGVTVDITGPTVNIIFPINGSPVCTNQVLVTGTVSDPSGIYWSTLTIMVNGETPGGIFTNTLTGAWMATFSSAQVMEGTNTLVVSVFDDCGSGNYSSTTRSFIVDTVKPTAVITSPSDGECIYDSTLAVSGTANDSGSGVASVWVNALTTQIVGENWIAFLNDLPNGPLTITATVADNCGNLGLTSIMVGILFNLCREGSWSGSVNISNSPGFALFPSVAVESPTNLHVVWDDDPTGIIEIYYSGFTGGSWSPTPENISNTSGDSQVPSIAVDSSGDLHVVWDDDTTGISEIYYSRFTGGSWSPTPENISNNPGVSWYPSIAADSLDNLHVVWQDDTTGNTEIYYCRFTGGSWSPTPENISNTSGDSQEPSIAVESPTKLHVVWYDDTSGIIEIYYSGFTGGSWSPTPENISNTPGNSYYPSIAVDSSGDLHVVWADDIMGIFEIYYSGFIGGSWSPTTENISNTPGNSLFSSIGVDSSDNLHVVWMDGITDDIYYKIGKGMCWWPSPINVSNTSRWAEFPFIAVDSNDKLHLVYPVWEATCDIYYNRCPP